MDFIAKKSKKYFFFVTKILQKERKMKYKIH